MAMTEIEFNQLIAGGFVIAGGWALAMLYVFWTTREGDKDDDQDV